MLSDRGTKSTREHVGTPSCVAQRNYGKGPTTRSHDMTSINGTLRGKMNLESS